jgi:hypothetical protein
MRVETILRLAFVVGLMALPASSSVMVVSPNGNANNDGNSNNGEPFNNPIPERYQQVYDSSQFGAIVGLHYITGIAFRPDALNGGAFSSVINSIQIDMSTTQKHSGFTSGGLSTTFADNVGIDDAVVFSGDLSLTSSFSGGPPHPFDIVIVFMNPFAYDPANGNLLMDVRTFDGSSSTVFDADFVLPGSGGLNTNGTSRVAGGINATNGLTDQSVRGGLVTEFMFTDVPEPSTIVGGLAALAIFNRCRTRGHTIGRTKR